MALSVPVIAITMGDPAGIGPELAVRIAADPKWSGRAEFVIYGEETVLREAAHRWSDGFQPRVRPSGTLPFGRTWGGRCAVRTAGLRCADCRDEGCAGR